MEYKVKTFQGHIITLTSDFDPVNFLSVLNNEQIQSIAMGNVSTLKHNIKTIYPVYDETDEPVGELISIFTTSEQDPLTAYAENFNAGDITQNVNDRFQFLLIGDTIINRNDYSLVMPQQ